MAAEENKKAMQEAIQGLDNSKQVEQPAVIGLGNK